MNLNSPQNPQENNFDPNEWISYFWNKVPIFVRVIIISTLFHYLVSFFSDTFVVLFQIIPDDVVRKFQIWKIFTSIIINKNIFNILFAFISWIPDGMRLENSNGTVKYVINFFLNNTIIQICFILISFFLGLFIDGISTLHSMGIWPAIMAEITMLAISSGENYVSLFFIPYKFRAKFYPLFVFGFLFLMNGFYPMIDVFIGGVYGFLYFYKLKNYLNLSDENAMKIESYLLFLNRITGFVPFQNPTNSGSYGYLQSKLSNSRNNDDHESLDKSIETSDMESRKNSQIKEGLFNSDNTIKSKQQIETHSEILDH